MLPLASRWQQTLDVTSICDPGAVGKKNVTNFMRNPQASLRKDYQKVKGWALGFRVVATISLALDSRYRTPAGSSTAPKICRRGSWPRWCVVDDSLLCLDLAMASGPACRQNGQCGGWGARGQCAQCLHRQPRLLLHGATVRTLIGRACLMCQSVARVGVPYSRRASNGSTILCRRSLVITGSSSFQPS